jgi:hypothetical protein
VFQLLWLVLGGVEIVANTSEATVIFLQSHPAWIAAQRRAQERSEAMHRHPSFRRHRIGAPSGDVVPAVRNFKVYSSTDTPA